MALGHTFSGVPTRNDVLSGQIQYPIAWKHARTGHFEKTWEEVEVHKCQCPLVEHLSGGCPGNRSQSRNRVGLITGSSFSRVGRLNYIRLGGFLCQLTCQSADIMSSLCGVGVRVRVCVNNFFSKTTRPRDMLFFLKDTLSIEDEKLFKACKSVCSSVC